MLWLNNNLPNSPRDATLSSSLRFRIEFALDGSTLATSGFVTGIRLWSTSTGKQLANLGVADGLATAMSISRDNALLATAAHSNTAGGHLLEVWRIATGESLLCPKRGGEEIASLAFSPDGKYLAAGAQGVEIYELATGKMANGFGQTSSIQLLAFSPNGRMLAYRVANRLHFHDLIAGRHSEGIPAAQMTVTAFAFSEDGRCIATGGADGTILLWAAPNPQGGPPTPLTANQLDALWQDLAAANAAAGYRALRGLVAAGGPAVALLKDRLKPSQPPEPGLLDRLIVQLDSENWSERETASGRLAKLGEAARLALRRALEETKSAEVKWRVRALLNALASPLSAPPEALRDGRALTVLELMGTDEAEAALAALADVGVGRLGADARASLNRLRRAGHDSHRPQ